jgi:hypothetical protein
MDMCGNNNKKPWQIWSYVVVCISWHMAKGFCGTWLRACICEVIDVLRG